MQATARSKIIARFTVGAAQAIRGYDIGENQMDSLLFEAEKIAVADCGELASITRNHIEDAAKGIGITQ